MLGVFLVAFAVQEPPAPEKPPPHAQFQIGPAVEYWFPRFKGDMKVDGTSTSGTTIRLLNDLNLPDDASIFMYGGGQLGVRITDSPTEHQTVSFAAEYWSHTWSGSDRLKVPETLGDHSFPGGTFVESRYTLSSLLLDASLEFSSGLLSGAFCLSLLVPSARLRMESATTIAKESVVDLEWGIGLFAEVRPVPWALGGLSVKGFTSFDDSFSSGAADFRVYAGAAWGPFRLEGGYRVALYDISSADRSFSSALYGPYVSLSAVFRF